MKLKHFILLFRVFLVLLFILLLGPVSMMFSPSVTFDADWRTADRSSSGKAPDPLTHDKAIVQVYSARAFNWRAAFAVHTWIATKEKGAKHFEVHQVLGWNRWYDKPVVESEADIPDRSWYSQEPDIILDIRGEAAEELIPKIKQSVASYPYQNEYRLWPGPNSNTFIAYIGREVPELHLNLPPTAIGKDYLNGNTFIGSPPSGNGLQLSLFGALGVLVSAIEGIEFNVLGLSFGINPAAPSLRLPGIGIIE